MTFLTYVFSEFLLARSIAGDVVTDSEEEIHRS
jgi:hypothetical protein